MSWLRWSMNTALSTRAATTVNAATTAVATDATFAACTH